MTELSRIQYISSGRTQNEQMENIRQVLDTGADWIQLRWKEGSGSALFNLAEEVRALSLTYRARFIINDWMELAKAVDADGLHLGLQDGGIDEARRLLGRKKIIGGTANTIGDVIQRTNEGCDYIGLGPLRYTSTKAKLSPILGQYGYRKITTQLTKKSISSPPLFAIGGILESDINELLQTGIYGIAISSLLNRSPQSLNLIKQQYDSYIKHCE